MNTFDEIKENIFALRAELEKYPGARLLAATKTVPAEAINYAIHECGIKIIGENRVNELLEKYDAIDKVGIEIHFIGTLQTNKVKYIADKVDMIHSLDSEKLAREIDRRCSALGRVMNVLIEVNIAHEESKGGVYPEDVYSFYDSIKALTNVRISGLMTMAPAGSGEEGFRKYFTETKKLFDSFCRDCIPDVDNPVLSMGMSSSCETALECGSNLIRVGSRIFNARKYS